MQFTISAVPSAWGLRMKANWVWRALDSALVEAQLPPRNADFDYRSQRILLHEFRVLAAILSAIGRKPFDWLSWKTIQCRSSGFVRRQDLENAKENEIPWFLKPPNAMAHRSDHKKSRILGFFARFRLSAGSRGENTLTALGARIGTNSSR